MAEWKGVPYFFDAYDAYNGVPETVVVAVDKLPQVVVESSFSWEVVISSLVAAAISSFVAWYALRQNYRLSIFQNNLSSRKELSVNIRIAISSYLSLCKIAKQCALIAVKERQRNSFDNSITKRNEMNQAMKDANNEYYKLLLFVDRGNHNQNLLVSSIEEIKNSLNEIINFHPKDGIEMIRFNNFCGAIDIAAYRIITQASVVISELNGNERK